MSFDVTSTACQVRAEIYSGNTDLDFQQISSAGTVSAAASNGAGSATATATLTVQATARSLTAQASAASQVDRLPDGTGGIMAATFLLSLFEFTLTQTAVCQVQSTVNDVYPSAGRSFSVQNASTLAVLPITSDVTTITVPAGSYMINFLDGASAPNNVSDVASIDAKLSMSIVGVQSTTTALASSANPSIPGQLVTFTATVTPSDSGAARPTGMVMFKDDATTIGTGELDSSGVATFSTQSLALGTHPITAVYEGDANFDGSDSPTLSQSVEVMNADAAFIAHELDWDDETTGLEVKYEVRGEVAGPATGEVYWSAGPRHDERIGDIVHTFALDTAEGNHLDHVPALALANPPEGARWLLVVLDGPTATSGGPTAEPSEEDGVAALKLTVTPRQLQAVMGGPLLRSAAYVAPVNSATAERDIRTPARLAAFLAQIKHETGDLTGLTERGTVKYFKQTYGNRRPDIIPRGTTRPDQWYIGRGLIHLTARGNYQAASMALFGDDRLIRLPTLVASDPAIAARTAAWYWSVKQIGGQSINSRADGLAGDEFRLISIGINGYNPTITKAINDGKRYPNHWQDREKAYQKAIEVFFFDRSATNRVAQVNTQIVTNIADILPRAGDWHNRVNAGRRELVRRGLQSTLDAARAVSVGESVAVRYSVQVGNAWVVQDPVTVQIGGAADEG